MSLNLFFVSLFNRLEHYEFIEFMISGQIVRGRIYLNYRKLLSLVITNRMIFTNDSTAGERPPIINYNIWV